MFASASVAQSAKEDDAKTRRIVADYGSCMVSRKHNQVKAFVLSQEDVQPPRPIENCVGLDGTLRMSGAIYRAVFAEALLKHDFRDGLPMGMVPDPSAIAADAGPPDYVVARLETVGRCAARRDPGGSLGLLRTHTSSNEEDSRIGALLPLLKACGLASVLPQSISNVRGAVAVNLYRAAVEAVGTPGAKRN